jgi:cysteine-rich repeat protein
MIVGSSGACIETCGDGKSYGMHMCDDGNQKNGDGCSDKCVVEKNFKCSGGYPYSKDNCSYVETEIVGVETNIYNDIIVKFSRPIYFRNGTLIPNKDLELSYRN